MEERLKTEQQMIRYLMGEMSIEEQIAMETGYFNDPEKFNLLQVVEHDLIEGYVNGKLSASGRAKFEHHFLSTPARLEQVRFFQTLAKVVPFEFDQQVSERTPVRAVAPVSVDLGQKSSWWESILSTFRAPFRGPRLALGMSFAAAMLILAIAGIWLGVGNRSQDDRQLATVDTAPSPDPGRGSNPDQPKQPIQEAQKTDINRERAEKPTTTKPAANPVIASFTLTIPGVVPGMRDIDKSGTAPQVWRIPPDANFVQMTFNHGGNPYDGYRVSLNYIESGQRAWSRSDVRASRVKSGTLLVLNVPAKRFDEGLYSLEISRYNDTGGWDVFHRFLIEVDR
jgi:hypothetical protein